jgi:hypothetical protein
MTLAGQESGDSSISPAYPPSPHGGYRNRPHTERSGDWDRMSRHLTDRIAPVLLKHGTDVTCTPICLLEIWLPTFTAPQLTDVSNLTQILLELLFFQQLLPIGSCGLFQFRINFETLSFRHLLWLLSRGIGASQGLCTHYNKQNIYPYFQQDSNLRPHYSIVLDCAVISNFTKKSSLYNHHLHVFMY